MQSDKSYLLGEKKTFDVRPFFEMKAVSCGTCRSVTSRNLLEATKLTALSHSHFGRSKYVERDQEKVNTQMPNLKGIDRSDRWLL